MGSDLLASFDPVLLAVALTMFFIGGLSKGVLGFGLPILAIPALTIASSLPMALSIALVPVTVTNVYQAWAYRTYRHIPFLKWFLVFGVIGLGTGAYLLSRIDEAALKITLGVLVLVYIAIRNWQGNLSVSARIRDRIAPVTGGIAGLVHGMTGLSGLIGTPFFHAAGLARPAFVFCNGAMFLVFSTLHMPALAAVGLYRIEGMTIGILSLVPSFLGLWLGDRLGARLPAAAFSVLVQLAMTCTALLSIWNGFGDLSPR